MTWHRAVRAASIAMCAAVVAGLVALAVLSDASVVAALVPLVVSIAMVISCYLAMRPSATGSRPSLWRIATAAAAASLVAGLALAGLITLAGPAAAPVLDAAVLCAVTVWWFRSRMAAWRWVPLGKAATQRLEARSTVELCLYWQASHRRLRERMGPLERAGIAEVRRGLLVEFERRDPAGFARFIDDPDSAAGNPGRFFRASDSPEIPPQPDR